MPLLARTCRIPPRMADIVLLLALSVSTTGIYNIAVSWRSLIKQWAWSGCVLYRTVHVG